MLDESTYYRLLKLRQDNPQLSQRELAQAMGARLGKANYCLKALVERGWSRQIISKIPPRRTTPTCSPPKGIEENAHVTLQFLKRKQREHETLQIERLHIKVSDLGFVEKALKRLARSATEMQ